MPEAAAVNVVGRPGGTERPAGCVVMTGGTSTISVAAAFAEPETLETVSE